MIGLKGTDVKAPLDAERLKDAPDSLVSVDACVHRVRDMGAFSFVILRTGRYVIQCVYSPETCKSDFSDVRTGVFVSVEGRVRVEPRANYGAEIVLSQIRVISKPESDYPLTVSHRRLDCTLETNLDNRTVALRNPYERAIFKLEEGVAAGFRDFMTAMGFTEIHSPKIVAAGAEGGANLFKLDYFSMKAYLSQSPQFYKQTTVAFFDRVFEIAPVFRAEKHNTSRHLNEYIGLDFEMGYIRGMTDVMEMETAMLRHLIGYLKAHYRNELSILKPDLPVIDSIPVITFMEALDILGKKNRPDLDPDDEVRLCAYAQSQWNSEFLFVTHFPSAKRPVYAMDDREDARFALSFDLLFRGLEITTGGQRIHDYREQVAKMQRMGYDPEEFKSYLDIFKYGMPPHGGLGLGLERLTMKLLNLTNIRETSMFPRDVTRIDP